VILGVFVAAGVENQSCGPISGQFDNLDIWFGKFMLGELFMQAA